MLGDVLSTITFNPNFFVNLMENFFQIFKKFNNNLLQFRNEEESTHFEKSNLIIKNNLIKNLSGISIEEENSNLNLNINSLNRNGIIALDVGDNHPCNG